MAQSAAPVLFPSLQPIFEHPLLKQLEINQTFFIMFALFGLTYFTVSFLLTRPLSGLLVEREKRTAGRQDEISKIRVELSDITEKLTAERRKAQQEASTKFAELRASAVTEQRKILTDAREVFAGKVKAARDNIDKVLKEERQKLERSSVELKDEVVAKLLGMSAAKNHSLGKEI